MKEMGETRAVLEKKVKGREGQKEEKEIEKLELEDYLSEGREWSG